MGEPEGGSKSGSSALMSARLAQSLSVVGEEGVTKDAVQSGRGEKSVVAIASTAAAAAKEKPSAPPAGAELTVLQKRRRGRESV